MNVPGFLEFLGTALQPVHASIVAYAAALLSLFAAGLHLATEREPSSAIGRMLVLAPLAWVLTAGAGSLPSWPALTIGLVIATLARERDDVLHSECAIKLLWVMGSALALSWTGLELLVLMTGTANPHEQWAVLALGLEDRFLWSTAVPLSLLVGFVLIAAPPFHFWAADLFHGARPWLAPLAVASLQVTGVAWIARRLEGIAFFPAGAELTRDLLSFAALSAFVVGGATLIAQRHPERRVGTLASLNGALVLAVLSGPEAGEGSMFQLAGGGVWAAHLVLALTGGAGTLARLVPVSAPRVTPGPTLFRRHPWSGAIGLYSLASLAGVPGTPGSALWLGVTQRLFDEGRTELLLALGFAWLAAFSAAVRQAREAFGIVSATEAPSQPVPRAVRGALWVTAAALIVIAAVGMDSR